MLQHANIDVALFNYGLHYHTESNFREAMGSLFGQLQQWSRARPGRVALYREQASSSSSTSTISSSSTSSSTSSSGSLPRAGLYPLTALTSPFTYSLVLRYTYATQGLY